MNEVFPGHEDKPLVSIIVPVYKVEKYLSRCVESIIGQTYRNIEVFLVDDGSPDKCGEICDQYAEKYPYIFALHQENQGISGARNNAALKSHGAYITFVDSDDLITPDYVEYLLDLIKKYGADISIASRIYQYDNKPLTIPREETKSYCCSPEETLIRMNYGLDFSVYAWCKMYRRELVLKHPYPLGMLYEDVATTYKMVSDSARVAFGNKQIYYWVQRSGSIMNSKFNMKQLDGITVAEQQLQFIEKHYPKAVPAARYRYTAKAVEIAGILFSTGGDRDVFKQLQKSVKKYAKEVKKDHLAKRSIKMRIIAMEVGYFPAKVVLRLHDRMKKITI